MEQYLKFWSFGQAVHEKHIAVKTNVVSALADVTQHGLEESVETKFAGDICLAIFLIIYVVTWFLRSDSIPSVILKYIGAAVTGCFLIIGLFLDGPTLLLKIAIGATIAIYAVGTTCKLALAIRCNSCIPFVAEDDCFVCYSSGGYNYCMPFDPNGPYITLVVHGNGITCGSYKIYGAVSLADSIQLITLTTKTNYSLQSTFDTGICIIAFYMADIAMIENHTAVGDNLKLEIQEPVYEVPSATINVPL